MKRSMKVFGAMMAVGMGLSTLGVSAHYGEKGCWSYRDHSCFNENSGQCINYVDANNDGICDHCWKVDQSVSSTVTTVGSSTYNSGNTGNYYGYHHGNHHGRHNCW